jgi:tetratricopeptide (TPR) repeat protein
VGEYNDFMGGYYHNQDFGFGHWALYDDMPGRKLWLWSLARDGGIWEDLLTDSDGQYMEFQAGRMFNQYGGTSAFQTPISQTPFHPDLTDRWHEIWFPVKGIGGITDVSESGALHTQLENNKLSIGINAFASVKGKILVKSGSMILFDEQKEFRPMEVFNTIIDLKGNHDYEVTVTGMDLHYDPSKVKYIDRPFESSINTEPATASAYFQQGMELKAMRDYTSAKATFKKCLEMDHLYIDAYAALADLFYRSMNYDSVFYYANAALQLDTYHPGTNYIAGLNYLAMGDMTNALETLGWAARSPEYRSAAYEKMAAAEFILNNLTLAGHYSRLSLDYNRHNLNALQILALVNRLTGESKKAGELLLDIENIDQTGHFSSYELLRMNPSIRNMEKFISSIGGEMPYQAFLDLSMFYNSLNLKNEATDVIDIAPSHPLVSIWRAYLRKDPSLLEDAQKLSPAFVFPHRAETVSALEWAVENNRSWKFRYYLALNLAAIDRITECKRLMLQCGQEPDYAPFYLTRASILNEEELMLPDLLKARELEPSDWRAAVKLINYYRSKNDFSAELKTASEAYLRQKNNSSLGIEYAVALINNRQYAKSLQLLDGMNILPNEGASQGKRVFEQAALMLSMDLIEAGKFSNAMKIIDKSAEWPENLGVGKPYRVDTRIQDYLKDYCLNKLNRKPQIDPGMIKNIRGELEKSSSALAKRALDVTKEDI